VNTFATKNTYLHSHSPVHTPTVTPPEDCKHYFPFFPFNLPLLHDKTMLLDLYIDAHAAGSELSMLYVPPTVTGTHTGSSLL
jgi:hypothetical protein